MLNHLTLLRAQAQRFFALDRWRQGDFRDPITGDALTAGEYISWKIQGVIRRWAFLGIITLLTIICWATRNAEVLTWWNLAASYMALLIESIVGLAMFNQTKRDAVIIRHILAGQQHQEAMETRIMSELATTRQELAEARVENAELRQMIAVLCEHFALELTHAS